MSCTENSEYVASFSAKLYLQGYYSSVGQDWTTKFRLKVIREFFQKYHSKWDRSSARLLEFSGGPVIANYISAAPHVGEIVHSAHTEGERRELELWKNNAEGAHDWLPFIKHIVSDVEGLQGEAAVQERITLLRSKITKIVSCNIHDKNPVDIEEGEKFSIVCSSFALEVACKTYDEYKAGIKKLVKLLRLGGYIAILLAELETFYCVGKEKWSMLSVSMDQLKEALEEAGCVVLMSERDPASIHHIENPTITDDKACVFIAAYKVKE